MTITSIGISVHCAHIVASIGSQITFERWRITHLFFECWMKVFRQIAHKINQIFGVVPHSLEFDYPKFMLHIYNVIRGETGRNELVDSRYAWQRYS